MAGEKQREARDRLAKFGGMTLDDLAVAAAEEPGSVISQVVEIEMKRRVAVAQEEAAKAQKDATVFLKRTAAATVVLAIATFVLAIATILLVLVTYLAMPEEESTAPTSARWLMSRWEPSPAYPVERSQRQVRRH